MTIPVYQSDLNRMGITIPWGNISRPDRQRIASIALRERGDNRTAFLLEINNPNAVAAITYVNNMPQRR